MIMSMFRDVYCISLDFREEEESLEEYLGYLTRVARLTPRAIVLRNKQISRACYQGIATALQERISETRTPLILHTHYALAMAMQIPHFHAPLSVIEEMPVRARSYFQTLGTSVHSLEELQRAEALGCTQVFAGHIFSTSCKPDLPPRGIGFLTSLCRAASIPVYAIGGIGIDDLPLLKQCGASGVCIRSGFRPPTHLYP